MSLWFAPLWEGARTVLVKKKRRGPVIEFCAHCVEEKPDCVVVKFAGRRVRACLMGDALGERFNYDQPMNGGYGR